MRKGLRLRRVKKNPFERVDEDALLVSILLFLAQAERLAVGCCVSKRFCDLRTRPDLWPCVQLRSLKAISSRPVSCLPYYRTPRLTLESLLRLTKILRRGGTERLEVEDGSLKSVAGIGFLKGWKVFFMALQGPLKALTLKGSVFKTAALKLVASRFGQTLESLEISQNDTPLKGLVDLLKKTPNLKSLGIDHLSADAAEAFSKALGDNSLERLVVFKRSAHADCVSFAFVVTRLSLLFPNLVELDLKQLALVDRKIPPLLDEERNNSPMVAPRRSTESQGNLQLTSSSESRRKRQATQRRALRILLSGDAPRPFLRLRILSFSLRLTSVESLLPSVAQVVGELVAQACPVLEALVVDFEATASACVCAPLLAGLENQARLNTITFAGLHVSFVDADAHDILHVLAKSTWLNDNLNTCRLVFSDLPFYALVHREVDLARAWSSYFRAVFANVNDRLLRLPKNKPKTCLSQRHHLHVGIVDRRRGSLFQQKTPHCLEQLRGVHWLQTMARLLLLKDQQPHKAPPKNKNKLP